MRKLDKATIERDVMQMLKLVDLEGFENRYPREMSGGQRQRVALARAMVIKPDLMLFDEPLSNLDAKLRVKMRVEIRRIQQELGFTAIYVTHDQEECFAISDKVAIMNKGVIEQMDAPSTIYNSPNTEFIARFVGFENFFELTRAPGRRFHRGGRHGHPRGGSVAGRALQRAASARRTCRFDRRGEREQRHPRRGDGQHVPWPPQPAQRQDRDRRICRQRGSNSGLPGRHGGDARADGE